MLKVEAYTDIFKIKMSGHCGFAEPGKDIVCSAASMAFYGLAKTLGTYEHYLDEKPFIHIDEGKDKDGKNSVIANIVAIPGKGFEAYFSIMFTQAYNQLKLLSEGYPDYVCIEEKTADEEKEDTDKKA